MSRTKQGNTVFENLILQNLQPSDGEEQTYKHEQISVNQIGNDLELGNDGFQFGDDNITQFRQSEQEQKVQSKKSGWVSYIMSKVKWLIIVILVVFILVFLVVYIYRRKQKNAIDELEKLKQQVRLNKLNCLTSEESDNSAKGKQTQNKPQFTPNKTYTEDNSQQSTQQNPVQTSQKVINKEQLSQKASEIASQLQYEEEYLDELTIQTTNTDHQAKQQSNREREQSPVMNINNNSTLEEYKEQNSSDDHKQHQKKVKFEPIIEQPRESDDEEDKPVGSTLFNQNDIMLNNTNTNDQFIDLTPLQKQLYSQQQSDEESNKSVEM